MSTEKLMDAMALWEHIIDCRERRYENVFSYYGYAGARERASHLVDSLEPAWKMAIRCGYDEAFDWEFIPAFMYACVDHETLKLVKDPKEWVMDTYGPKVFMNYILKNNVGDIYELYGVDVCGNETLITSRQGKDAIWSLVEQMSIVPISEARLAS